MSALQALRRVCVINRVGHVLRAQIAYVPVLAKIERLAVDTHLVVAFARAIARRAHLLVFQVVLFVDEQAHRVLGVVVEHVFFQSM